MFSTAGIAGPCVELVALLLSFPPGFPEAAQVAARVAAPPNGTEPQAWASTLPPSDTGNSIRQPSAGLVTVASCPPPLSYLRESIVAPPVSAREYTTP